LSLQTPEPTLAPTDPETIREELVELHAEQQTEQQIDEKRSAGKKLESTAVKATVWVVADYGVSMALRVLNSVVLTHLLMPESFGLVTLVSTLVTGISLLSDIGLNSSVIQSPRGDDPVFLNTAWTVQVLRGLGIFVVALLLSWPMSLFYHDPRLIWLLPALALNIVVQAFWSTGLLSMSRHMGVRRVFLLDISTQIFALLVTAGLAYMYRSVWALVIGTVLGSAYKLVLSHFRGLIPGVRNRFCWDPESVQGLIHFGKWILLATAFFFFASQADRLILGKLIQSGWVSVYRQNGASADQGIQKGFPAVPPSRSFGRSFDVDVDGLLRRLPGVENVRSPVQRRDLDGADFGAGAVAYVDVCHHDAGPLVSGQVQIWRDGQCRVLFRCDPGNSDRVQYLGNAGRGGGCGRGRLSALPGPGDGSEPGRGFHLASGFAGDGRFLGDAGVGIWNPPGDFRVTDTGSRGSGRSFEVHSVVSYDLGRHNPRSSRVRA
jgi:hypothetical protein